MVSQEKAEWEKRRKKERYDEALSEYLAGKFSNLKECARHFDISYSTLHTHVVAGDNFGYVGQGRKLSLLTSEEEKEIVDHINMRVQIGYGLTKPQLACLIQRLLIVVCEKNPKRKSPWYLEEVATKRPAKTPKRGRAPANDVQPRTKTPRAAKKQL